MAAAGISASGISFRWAPWDRPALRLTQASRLGECFPKPYLEGQGDLVSINMSV